MNKRVSSQIQCKKFQNSPKFLHIVLVLPNLLPFLKAHRMFKDALLEQSNLSLSYKWCQNVVRFVWLEILHNWTKSALIRNCGIFENTLWNTSLKQFYKFATRISKFLINYFYDSNSARQQRILTRFLRFNIT